MAGSIFGQIFSKYGSSRQAEGSRSNTSPVPKSKPAASKVKLCDSRKEAREAALRERGLLPPVSSTSTVNHPTTELNQNQPQEQPNQASHSEPTTTSLPPRPSSPALSDVSETETLFEEPRSAVNPTVHTRESIWRAVNEIEDYETRRVTTLAFLG
ncbi:hypothetical protein VNI00_004164 [Paramarasmius palmivorus]|uniref:Uncharacterized protein n=1 Tax=Paramarasmius palmivorus TaxID=297713 RepID=A0AAW0DM97_9AGAR